MTGRISPGVRRVTVTRLPTRWGVFQAAAFERERPDNPGQVETAVVLTMGDLSTGRPLHHGSRADLARFCRRHGVVMITVAELARYRFDLEYEEALAIAS